jgi:membrane fusion protein (multidrug efflux system)
MVDRGRGDKQHHQEDGRQPHEFHGTIKPPNPSADQNERLFCCATPGEAVLIGAAMSPVFSRLSLPLAVLLVLSACSEKEKPAPPEMTVPVAAPVQQKVPVVREWVGMLEGLVNANIVAQVSGYLVSQNYDNGSLVKKGQLLFQIDPRPFRAALDQAAGQLQEAEARLIRDEANAKRAVELLDKNVISREQYDDEIQAFEASKAATAAAQAAVEQARLNLEFTSITAPIDGLAGINVAQVGNLIGPSTGTLTTVTMVDPIKANFYISDYQYLNYIKPYYGDPDKLIEAEKKGGFGLQIVLADGTVYPHPGRLMAINNVVGQGTGALEVQAQFPNPGNLLRAGQFARVRGVVNWIDNALLVPQRAINDLQGKSQIAVIGSDGKVDLRLVQTGPVYASMRVVTEGLNPGEQVVIEGMQKLRQGMTVKTTPWQMPPGFNVDPSLPAPQMPPAGGDYMIKPPEAALEGAPAPQEPVVPPPAAPTPAATPTPLPEPAATPA